MDFVSKLCRHFNLTYEEFKNMISPKTLSDIPSFNHFNDIDKVVLRIKKAIENQEKIFIYGDYDCDGIMATSILVKAFELLDYSVGYYIPSRLPRRRKLCGAARFRAAVRRRSCRRIHPPRQTPPCKDRSIPGNRRYSCFR